MRPATTTPKRVFVDTQGWAEAFHQPGLHHAQAAALLPQARAEQWDQQAWGVLYANPQQHWSHVDATSMALMRQLGLTEVFTADHHFEQAGFTILL